MKVGERYLSLSGKFHGKFVAVDHIEPSGEIIICHGGDWDRTSESDLMPIFDTCKEE